MISLTTRLMSFQPHALSLLRLMAGLLFLQHGTTKMLSFPVTPASGPALFALQWFAGSIELICGVLIVLGLFTRPAAFVASGFTAVAYFMAHFPRAFFPIMNGGELAALYCFVFLFLVFAGAGPWSLDQKVLKRG